MRNIFLNLRILLLVSLSFSAYAQRSEQDSLQSLMVLSIDEVTVVGNKLDRETIPVHELAGDELKRLSVNSVADAVRYFSGVQVKDYGGIGGLKTVNIRSMGSHHVGVFYDGVELGNAQNGVVDLGRFSLDNMEAISMYNGQKSAIFQPAKDYASASAIYMATRRPQFEEGKHHNVKLGMKGGSFDTMGQSVLWESKLSDKVSASLSSEYLYTSGEYKFSYSKKDGYDTTEVRKNGDVMMLRAEAALFGKLDGGEWRAKSYYYNSERGYPGASVREEPGKFKNQDRQWDENFFVQGSYRQQLASFYSLLVNGKYAYDYLHYLSDPRQNAATMYINNRYRQQEAYLSAAHLFNINHWWSASLSNDFQYNYLDANLVGFVYPNRYTLLSAAATSIELQRFKLQASLLHTYTKDKTRKESTSNFEKSIFTPSVVASWQPFQNSGLNLRAFYKSMFRMPTLNDLYYSFIGNIDLDPEYTIQYNLGATYGKNLDCMLRRVEFQLDGYFNQIDDKIIAIPTSNQFRWTMLNLGYVEIRGLDAMAEGQWQFGDLALSTRVNYTYQRAQDFTDPSSAWYGGQIPYVPWHSGTLILSASYRGWECNYSFIYTGERYESVANILENYAQPWYTHDISVTKNFEINGTQFRATAELNNILNQQYEVVQCYPMPGINFMIKLNIQLSN